MTFHIWGMSSSQLTNIFWRVETTNQIYIIETWGLKKIMMNMIYIYGIKTLTDWSNYVDDNYPYANHDAGIFTHKTG
jgi:hypothetical protein